MKKIIAIILIGMFSCKSTERSLVGKYERYWDFEHYTSLQLNPDSSFVLEGQEGLVRINTEGTWKVENGELVLNSYPATSLNSLSILESEETVKGDSVLITVTDDGNDVLSGVTVLAFHEGDTIVADYTKEDGVVAFKKQPYDSISFSTYGFFPFTYIGKSNRLKVKMGLNEMAPIKFKNEKWRIKRNFLLDPRFEGEQSENKYKKKTSR